MAVDNDTKVRENRARRKAARQGLELTKARSRDPHAADYGLFALIDRATGKTSEFVDIEQIEKLLVPAKRRRTAKSKPKLPAPSDDDRIRSIVMEVLREVGLVAGDRPKPGGRRRPSDDETPAEERERLARGQRWHRAAQRAWVKDHPGHTTADFDLWGSCAATPEQERHWLEWDAAFTARYGKRVASRKASKPEPDQE